MKKTLTIIFTIIFTLLAINSMAKAEVKVVTSIKPIHSLVSYVMDGVGKPDIIVDGYNSPHNFSLKPSHAKMIEKANLIIWVGEDLETFLEKPLKTISKDAVIFEIMDFKGEVALYELIKKVSEKINCGILLISHDLHVVMSATDYVVCLNGHVCCSGTPQSVANNHQYKELFGDRASAVLSVYEHKHDHSHSPDGTIKRKQ